MRIAASLRVRCFNVSYPRGQARTIVGRQGAVAGAFQQSRHLRLVRNQRQFGLRDPGPCAGSYRTSCIEQVTERMRKMMASPELHRSEIWYPDAGRSGCGAAFELLSTLAKCDVLWSAARPTRLIPANG
jgi:hypothetical protein